MNLPIHLLIQRASVFRVSEWSVEQSGEAIPKVEDEFADVPCRIEAVSSSDGIQYASETGTIRYDGFFPSAAVALRDYGLIDFAVRAKDRVVIDDVTYRVVGPGVNMGAANVMQRVPLETENQELAPA